MIKIWTFIYIATYSCLLLGVYSSLSDLAIHSSTEKCVWKFKEYIPSAYEKQWTDNIAKLQHNVCEESNKHVRENEAWMAFKHTVLSRFVFENSCNGEKKIKHIEPLAGLTRSPRYCSNGDAFVVEKEYLYVNAVEKEYLYDSQNKNFYFDLGASMYNTGAGGPSQSWFVETYEAKGIHWDGIYAWEASHYSPSEVWQKIPPRLKPIYHWYNIAVNPEPGHADNALEYIKQTARAVDYVLLKIDIDNNKVEESLIHQLLNSTELMGLVDELYFEHHVNTKAMHKYWGTEGSTLTLEDSYKLFTSLRERGVMAHSWV